MTRRGIPPRAVAVVLATTVAFCALLGLALKRGWPVDWLRSPWPLLAAETAAIFWVPFHILARQPHWGRSPRFWIGVFALLTVHLTAWAAVLLSNPHLGLLWFVLICPVEVYLVGRVLMNLGLTRIHERNRSAAGNINS